MLPRRSLRPHAVSEIDNINRIVDVEHSIKKEAFAPLGGIKGHWGVSSTCDVL